MTKTRLLWARSEDARPDFYTVGGQELKTGSRGVIVGNRQAIRQAIRRLKRVHNSLR